MDRYDDPNERREPADSEVARLLAGLAADDASDPTPEQVSALFAVALDGEPPSTVTAASVLREVRAAAADRPARFLSAEWFARNSGAWKWGGGLVAAAAVAGAVVLAVPQMGGSSTDSAMSVAAGAEAQADSGLSAAAEKVAGADARAGSDTAADGSQQAAPEAPAMAGAQADEPSAGTSANSPEAAAQPSADSAGTGGTAPSAEAYDTASGGGTSDSSRSACVQAALPRLLPAEHDAAAKALAAGGVRSVIDAEACVADVARGETLALRWAGANVTVLLSRADIEPPSAGEPSAGESYAAQDADGALTVGGGSAAWNVTVTANPAAAAHVGTAELGAVAQAVLAAAG